MHWNQNHIIPPLWILTSRAEAPVGVKWAVVCGALHYNICSYLMVELNSKYVLIFYRASRNNCACLSSTVKDLPFVLNSFHKKQCMPCTQILLSLKPLMLISIVGELRHCSSNSYPYYSYKIFNGNWWYLLNIFVIVPDHLHFKDPPPSASLLLWTCGSSPSPVII